MARQRFVELIAQGVPFRVAAIEVGVSRSAAQIWKNGTLAAWEHVKRFDANAVIESLHNGRVGVESCEADCC